MEICTCRKTLILNFNVEICFSFFALYPTFIIKMKLSQGTAGRSLIVLLNDKVVSSVKLFQATIGLTSGRLHDSERVNVCFT